MRPAGVAVPAAIGLAAGLAVALLESQQAGALRPVVVVVLLSAVALASGLRWGWAGWPGALAAALPVPALHLARLVIGLPDFIRPGTLDAITMMALFDLAVCGAGLAAGAVLRQAMSDESA